MKMKNDLVMRCLISFSTLFACLAWGQSPSSPASLETPSPEALNRFGVSFRMGFNMTVSFENLGGFPAQGHLVPGQGLQPANPGTATGGGQNRTYEDGYNWVNSGGNPQGLTTYWGYDDRNSQYNESAATLTLHSTSSDASASSKNRDGDPLLGFEITYNRELFRNASWRWGLEAAFGFTELSVRDHRPLSANATRINDTFVFPFDPETGGRVTPPQATSYSGPFTPAPEGSPFLSDSPNQSPYSRQTETIPGGATITGNRSFDADVFGFRLGPYVDIPLGESMLLSFSGGLALAQVDSDFKFDEMVTIAGVGSVSHSGSGSHNDLLVGGYVSGNLNLMLSKVWGLFGGVQFQDVGHYTHRLGNSEAKLDLSESVFVLVGATYSF